jgi:hypothetical protein
MARKLTNGERYTFQKIVGSTAIISDSTDGAEKSENYIRSNTLIISSSNNSATLRVSVGDSTTNDPTLRFNVDSQFYTIGIDNSQNDDFAISQVAGLPGAASANTVLRIPNGSGNVHVRNDLIVTGSISGNLVSTTTTLGVGQNYSVLDLDAVIYVAASGLGTRQVILPTISSAINGRQITVIIQSITSAGVQITPSGGNTINGAANKVANGQYESITVIANNATGIWYIKSEYPAGSWI